MGLNQMGNGIKGPKQHFLKMGDQTGQQKTQQELLKEDLKA